MSDTLLKKEFKRSDVERIRNLVKKDFKKSTTVGTGYKKNSEFHKEGDIWEEDGRKWTLKNGIKQNITKLDFAKDLYKIPLTCPKCNTSMNYHLHKKMYRIHGFCFDCTIEYEANLRKIGKYEEYEKAMITGNILSFVKDLEDYVKDSLKETSTFTTEAGDVEEWKNNSSKQNDKVLRELNEFSTRIRSSLQS